MTASKALVRRREPAAASQAGRAEVRLDCDAKRNTWIWRDPERSETGSRWLDTSPAGAFTPDQIEMAASAESPEFKRAALYRAGTIPGCVGGKLAEGEGKGVRTAAVDGENVRRRSVAQVPVKIADRLVHQFKGFLAQNVCSRASGMQLAPVVRGLICTATGTPVRLTSAPVYGATQATGRLTQHGTSE